MRRFPRSSATRRPPTANAWRVRRWPSWLRADGEQVLSNLGIRLDNLGAKTLKTNEHKMRMVADAVAIEPVSALQFPANREKNRVLQFRGDFAHQTACKP